MRRQPVVLAVARRIIRVRRMGDGIMRCKVARWYLAFLAFTVLLSLGVNSQQSGPSQWDDPPKYGELVLSITFQEISSTNLVLLHSMTIKKVTSIIGDRTLQIRDKNGKPMSISFTEYFKEVTFTSPDGKKGGFYRIELPRLKKKYQDEIINDCTALLTAMMAKEDIRTEWSRKIITNELPTKP